ncbi:molybdopterin biosynthesis protein [Halapricum hydrolyticum]|uniref:Molybdopterin biosynthesis protein n=1 Tax=Halapricum hydrolyticum TaxID=2979991 RepID=A0AAE3LE76_9EURY|nr:molybdopterin biosynthesis protein [Halapricum hydrolyticum]MCU4716785.1 molybdopterin biosynthesis protein [Halapricum hydrolyticum]MCU4725610.1 molybdopterin biosynthesis protein [Halapricum hydrolyticum]
MSDRVEFRDLTDPEMARETIAGLDLGGGTETVPLTEARGRVLAERVDATIDVPGFDRASMDGYAVSARETFGAGETDPVTLEIGGEVHAGEPPDVEVRDGTAVEISTGAVMPQGADAVVPVERTSPEGDRVAVRTAVTPGENVMLAGADIAAGERALGPGTELTAREIGLLAALGVASVPVRSKPRVGIVSTGEELVRPGEELDHAAGQIYDVNTHTVAAGVEAAGGEPVTYPHAGDDLDELESVLRTAAEECDLVLSSGSTSASTVDVIYRVVEDLGELLLHGVAVKPGRPMLVGRFESAAYVGLPGYPVSALTIFRTFVAPAIRETAGLPEPTTATATGEMAVRERYEEGRLRYVPVGLVTDGDGRTLVYPVDKGSGATTSLTAADGVVAMAPDVSELAAGEPVEVELFSPSVRAPSLLGVGEDDPALSRLLDRVDRPRYLADGSRVGRRWLEDGISDVAVLAGPIDPPEEAVEIGSWAREWGLVVPRDPAESDGLESLLDGELSFVNRPGDSGLRATFDDALEELEAERETSRGELARAITGYERTARAHESPARMVARGDADAGLGLRVSADRLGLGFVSLGHETVRVVAKPDRADKSGAQQLADALENSDVFGSLAGYERSDS